MHNSSCLRTQLNDIINFIQKLPSNKPPMMDSQRSETDELTPDEMRIQLEALRKEKKLRKERLFRFMEEAPNFLERKDELPTQRLDNIAKASFSWFPNSFSKQSWQGWVQNIRNHALEIKEEIVVNIIIAAVICYGFSEYIIQFGTRIVKKAHATAFQYCLQAYNFIEPFFQMVKESLGKNIEKSLKWVYQFLFKQNYDLERKTYDSGTRK